MLVRMSSAEGVDPTGVIMRKSDERVGCLCASPMNHDLHI